MDCLCHGPCSVTFLPKNNHRMAPMESLMMATSPLFSATLTTSHPRRTYIRLPSEFFLYSDTTKKSTFLSLPLPTSTMHYSTAAQPEPHHAPHMFHVVGQSYRTCTSSQGHGFWSPQGLVRIWVSTLQSTSLFIICSILQPYALLNISLYVYVLICINTQAVVDNLPVKIST